MQPDYLYWPKSRDGSYIVSSGYRWLCEEEKKEFASVSNSDRARGFWKKIYGNQMCWEKLSISYGKLAQMPCPRRRT